MLLPEFIIGFFYTFHKIHPVHRLYRQYKYHRKSYVNYFHNKQSLQAHYHSLHQIQALLLLYTMKVQNHSRSTRPKNKFIPRLFMYFQIINERLIRFSCIWPSRKTQCSIKIYRNNLFSIHTFKYLPVINVRRLSDTRLFIYIYNNRCMISNTRIHQKRINLNILYLFCKRWRCNGII